jgi:hypothetical protein
VIGRFPGPESLDGLIEFHGLPRPLRTPGPRGHVDAGDPDLPGPHGETPGPLGDGDYVEHQVATPVHWLNERGLRAATVGSAADLDLKALRSLIARHYATARPGHPADPARDAQGRLVVGFGFNLERSDARQKLEALGLDYALVRDGVQKLPHRKILQLFEDDLKASIAAARQRFATFDHLPGAVQQVLVAVAFHLGKDALWQTNDFAQAIEAEDFSRAAQVVEKAAWYGPGDPRSAELASMLRRAELVEDGDGGSASQGRRLPRFPFFAP